MTTETTTEKPMNKATLIDELVKLGKLKNKTAGRPYDASVLRGMLDSARFEEAKQAAHAREDAKRALIAGSLVGNGTAAEQHRIDAEENEREQYKEALNRDEPPPPVEPVTQEMVERDQYEERDERRGFSSYQEDRRGVKQMQDRRRMKNRVKHRRRIARLRSSGMIRG